MANNNGAVEIHSSADDKTVVSVTVEEKEETHNNVDPWPHLKKYFKVIREKNDKNVIYQSLAYLRIFKTLSVNRRSYDNLKAHHKSPIALQDIISTLQYRYSKLV